MQKKEETSYKLYEYWEKPIDRQNGFKEMKRGKEYEKLTPHEQRSNWPEGPSETDVPS